MTRVPALARLVRIPNAFTALADVSVGLVVTRAGATSPQTWLLLACSGCLYSAGMAWNDYFDRDVDRLERPSRPIPSGAITPGAARRVAVGLSAAGVAAAALASTSTPGPILLALALLTLILAYDARLNRTALGSVAMGGCRFLNVLLGFSLAPASVVPWGLRLVIAAVVGSYVVGVTLFACGEAGWSRRSHLMAAASVIFAAVMATLAVPQVSSHAAWRPLPYLVAGFILALLARLRPALIEPGPGQVQAFVKEAILGIIVLDAGLAAAAAGPAGLVILGWLIPAALIGRRVDST